ncbi:MAG: hypothetical protein J5658_08145 [Prevotella sp.]|nr:hypothetical protein [Prevotella sp.]
MMKNKVILLIATLVLSLSTSAASFETDRTWYLAGEAMKVNVTADNALIAYAELCDKNSLAAGVVIRLDGGKGTGTIELPSGLHSGYYLLSVYTRDQASVSHRLVAVINPLRKSKDDDIEWVSSDSSWVDHRSDPVFDEKRIAQSPHDLVRETEGHIIKAYVKNVSDDHTFKGNQIHPSISIIGKQIHYFEGKMVNDSIAVFYTYGIHGKQPLVLSALSSTGVSLPIEMASPFAAIIPKELPHLVFHYKRSEVETRSLDMQRHQIAIAPTEDITPSDYDETVFGTKPDLSYNLDEYRQFHTIREVLIEYVLCVSHRTVNGVQKLIVRREQDFYNTSLPTLVLIDGMPVFDVERLLNYDARRIHYINIYGGQYTFGNGVYNGILSFVTRSGRLTNYPTEPNMQYLVYDFPE